jgi:hypothetical protein
VGTRLHNYKEVREYERALTKLYSGLQSMKRETCPFVNLAEKPEVAGVRLSPCSHEALQLGRARAGGSSKVRRVDQR